MSADQSYPEHTEHLRKANLDPSYNLWYDIFDHNDPAKTHVNWALLPEDDYEAPWFPGGEECAMAVAQTAVGSVVRIEEESGMQAFTADQLKSMNTASSATGEKVCTLLSSFYPVPSLIPAHLYFMLHVAAVAPPLPSIAPPVASSPSNLEMPTAVATVDTLEGKLAELIGECVAYVPGTSKAVISSKS